MTAKIRLSLLALVLAATLAPISGRAQAGDKPAGPVATQLASGQATTYGATIPGGTATPLVTALAGETTSRDRVFSGRIGKVCQNKGCWMTLVDGDAMVRVETGYRFTIPKDAQGEAQVFGTLGKATLSEKHAEHLRAESLDVQAGDGWVIKAKGVRLLP